VLVGIGKKFSREGPKSPALPCNILYTFRATSVLDRFEGRPYSTPFFNLVLCQEGGSGISQLAASSLPGVALKQSWDSQSFTGSVVLQSGPVAGWCGALVAL